MNEKRRSFSDRLFNLFLISVSASYHNIFRGSNTKYFLYNYLHIIYYMLYLYQEEQKERMNMNLVEMYEKVKQMYEANESKYCYIGLRFEDKDREIGEECEYSRHNADREDEREFPAYDTEEYWEMEVLDGTSAWDMQPYENGFEFYPGLGRNKILEWEKEFTAAAIFGTNHCYVVAGNQRGNHDNPDDGEILIRDAVVIAKLF